MKVIYYKVKLVNNEWVLTHIARCQAGKGVTYMLTQRSKMGDFLSTIDTEDGDNWAGLGLVFSEYESSRGVTWETLAESNFDPSLKDGPSKEDFDLYMTEYMANLNRIYRKEQALKRITFMTHGHRKISESAICDKLISLAALQTRLATLSATLPLKPANPDFDGNVMGPIRVFLLERHPLYGGKYRIKVAGAATHLTELPNATILGMRHPAAGDIYYTFDNWALFNRKHNTAIWGSPTNYLSGCDLEDLCHVLEAIMITPFEVRRFDVPPAWLTSNDKELLSYQQVQHFLLTGSTNIDSVEAKQHDSDVSHTAGEASSSDATEPPKATQEKDIYYQIADVRRLIDKRRHELANLNNQLSELENRLAQYNKTERDGVPYTQQSGYGHHHFTRG